jgi:protein-tyrosine phosphatase
VAMYRGRVGVPFAVAAVRRTRVWLHRHSTRIYGPNPKNAWRSWIAGERIAISGVPTPGAIRRLREEGVTHVVNCRAKPQTFVSQDLAVERFVFGRDHVAHAPMWDRGGFQPPRLWSDAVRFAASALDNDPTARVLIHCHQGRRRSVMVAYAVLRLRGRTPDEAARAITQGRVEAVLVPTYQHSVEEWLATSHRAGPGWPDSPPGLSRDRR